MEYGLPPLGTKESPNPAYIIFLSVSRSPKASACWSTRYSLSARVISLSNSASLWPVTPLEEKEALFQMKGQASEKTSLRKVLLPFS